MKNYSLILKIAGVLNLLFLLFHLPFYWMFNWSETLSCLNDDNRNILLTFNVIGNLLLLYFTINLLFFTKQLVANSIGKLFLLLVASFYGIRIFAEFYFWSFDGTKSVVLIGLCAIPMVCCLIPVIMGDRKK